MSVPAAVAAQLLIVGLAILDGRRAAAVSVTRTIEGVRVLNGVLDVELHVRGAGAKVRLTDDIGAGLERLPPQGVRDASDPEGVALVTPTEGQAVVGYRLGLRRRGDLVVGSVHVRSLGPLGLAWRADEIVTEDVIRVLPGVEELRKERMPGLRTSLSAGARRLRRFGEGSEFESLREYRGGDDPRIVDWKASARRPQLVVRNYQVERNQTVILAIDAGRLMREWIGDRERLDYALTGAFLVAERARFYGDRVGLIVFDERVRTIMPPGRVRLSELADVFAGVEARLVEPNYPVAFATLRRSFRKRALVMLFSDVIDGLASRALVHGAVGATARHLPVVVALRNPDVEHVASTPRPDAGSPWRRAAGEALLEARARALQSMRHAGVHVVDALPGDAPFAALEEYGEIKRRGLL